MKFQYVTVWEAAQKIFELSQKGIPYTLDKESFKSELAKEMQVDNPYFSMTTYHSPRSE